MDFFNFDWSAAKVYYKARFETDWCIYYLAALACEL